MSKMETVHNKTRYEEYKAAGFTEQQAEKLATDDAGNLATKADLTAGLKDQKADIIWLMLIQTIAIVGLVAALVKL